MANAKAGTSPASPTLPGNLVHYRLASHPALQVLGSSSMSLSWIYQKALML